MKVDYPVNNKSILSQISRSRELWDGKQKKYQLVEGRYNINDNIGRNVDQYYRKFKKHIGQTKYGENIKQKLEEILFINFDHTHQDLFIMNSVSYSNIGYPHEIKRIRDKVFFSLRLSHLQFDRTFFYFDGNEIRIVSFYPEQNNHLVDKSLDEIHEFIVLNYFYYYKIVKRRNFSVTNHEIPVFEFLDEIEKNTDKFDREPFEETTKLLKIINKNSKFIIHKNQLLFWSLFNLMLDDYFSIWDKTKIQIDKIKSEFPLDDEGKILFIENKSFLLLVKKHQSMIIEKDKKYIHNFVKIGKYLDSKKQTVQLLYYIFEKSKSEENYNDNIGILRNEIHLYNQILFHSIRMIDSLLKDDYFSFYEVYELFDNQKVFNTSYENESIGVLENIVTSVDNMTSELSERLSEISLSIYNVGSKIISSIEDLSWNTQSSIESLTDQLDHRLREVNSGIQMGNLLSSIQTYQLYKINKNTKSLRG